MNDLIVLPEPPAAKDESTESKPDENAPTQPAPPPWRRYGYAACVLTLALSSGWAVGEKLHSLRQDEARREAKSAQSLAAAGEKERDGMRALRAEVNALRAKLDAAEKRRGVHETAAFEARIGSLDRKIEASQAEAAQLAAKLEKHEKSIERMAATVDKTSVSSIAKSDNKSEAKSEIKPAAEPAAKAESKPEKKPETKSSDAKPALSGFLVRGVDDGVALIQGPGGMYEVSPGKRLPGAGRVLSIEKNGRKWVVITDRGRIDGPASAPRHRYSQRREPDDYYIDERF